MFNLKLKTMCEVKGKSKRKSFTGYKIVTRCNNKYYSPVMGIEYIAGQKVTPINKISDANLDFVSKSWGSPSDIFNFFFDEKMKGKTGVFKTKKDAEYVMKFGNDAEIKEHVIKMTISGNLHHAINGGDINTIVGEFIESIEEIK